MAKLELVRCHESRAYPCILGVGQVSLEVSPTEVSSARCRAVLTSSSRGSGILEMVSSTDFERNFQSRKDLVSDICSLLSRASLGRRGSIIKHAGKAKADCLPGGLMDRMESSIRCP
jgi:hypothetical protein